MKEDKLISWVVTNLGCDLFCCVASFVSSEIFTFFKSFQNYGAYHTVLYNLYTSFSVTNPLALTINQSRFYPRIVIGSMKSFLSTCQCPAGDVSRIFWVCSLVTVSVANIMASVTNESVGIIDEMIRTWEDYKKITQIPLCVRKCHIHWLGIEPGPCLSYNNLMYTNSCFEETLWSAK